MKVAILDDWFDTLQNLPCFEKLRDLDVTIFNDHEEDVNKLANKLKPFDILVLFRERTAITAELLNQLPNLKLISQRSVCLLYTSPSPRDRTRSRMPSSA